MRKFDNTLIGLNNISYSINLVYLFDLANAIHDTNSECFI